MEILELEKKNSLTRRDDRNQRGSAIVVALFILILLSAFVALALSRTSTEAAAVGNETGEGRTFYAAQGSLETMTRNFNKVFETKLSPSNADLDIVRNGTVPEISDRNTLLQEVDKVEDNTFAVIDNGPYAGLYASRDRWRLRTTTTDESGIQVQLTRNILNNRIPIFQFGIFYNDNLEFHPGPRFDFGGRVHSNGSLFLMAQTGLYFTSRVSTVGEIITDTGRNGKPSTTWGENVFVKNGNNNIQLRSNMGSVLKSPANGIPVFNDLANNPKLYDPDMPVQYKNAGWSSIEATFGGNLLARQKSLELPLKLASAAGAVNTPPDYIELIKRGRQVGDLHNVAGAVAPVAVGNADDPITTGERFANKIGIRISLSNGKAQLPGCASGVGTAAINGPCGVRLDGASVRPAVNTPWGASDANNSRGYQPLQMQDGYRATRINGERFNTTAGETWIKIELVSKDDVNNVVVTQDVTEDILSLGVTEPAPADFPLESYGTTDSRSVIKLQRFVIPGDNFTGTGAAYMTYTAANNTAGAVNYNTVLVGEKVCAAGLPIGLWNDAPAGVDTVLANETFHYKATACSTLAVGGNQRRVVPFPIKMFDSREGVYNFNINFGTTYGTKVPWNGVMSMIDIDVRNLKRFLDGDFNAIMPNNTVYANTQGHVLRSSILNAAQNDIPQNNGWVVYVSDRRGDRDFDGSYDMEDIYGNNDGILQTGEDVNGSNVLDVNYTGLVRDREAPRYTADGAFTSAASPGSFVEPTYAATVDHPFYRRGVRLTNGQTLPGRYDSANSNNTRGFTVASENGVYVQGNYNATGITVAGSPTRYDQYTPLNTTDHVPASIVGDAVTILSNNWNDAKSFLYPYDITGNKRKATETYTRFAMLSGDAKSSFEATPNQGSNDPRLGGGVHNFKRFLEDWGSVRLNYCGSLINLYNARNNNGSFKVANPVYSPPNRNWVFDSTFLDPSRLPPGTPYFQYVQTTGFQRTND